MLPNLLLVLIFVYLIAESFKKVLIYCLAISNIVVYHITIISNILNKMVNYMKLRVIKDLSTYLGVDK